MSPAVLATRPMLDIYAEHVEEAAFLYLRRRRVFALMEGDARHQRALESRLEAHLDALHVAGGDAAPLLAPRLASCSPDELFVGAAGLLRSTESALAVEHLRTRAVPEGTETALRDALWFYGGATARDLVEHWLGGGDARLQPLALRVLARWGDARVEALGRRALRRDPPALRLAGFDALASVGARDAVAYAEGLLDAARDAATRAEVLANAARMDAPTAVSLARRLLAAGVPCGDVGPVLCGLAGTPEDVAWLGARFDAEAPVAGVYVGLALAGELTPLVEAWAFAEAPAVSNALREAAYVVLGGDVPPAVLGPRADEEPVDRARRLDENAQLRARMMESMGRGPFRWGGADSAEGLWGAYRALGAKHRRWAGLALTLEHGVRGVPDWEDLSARLGW